MKLSLLVTLLPLVAHGVNASTSTYEELYEEEVEKQENIRDIDWKLRSHQQLVSLRTMQMVKSQRRVPLAEHQR